MYREVLARAKELYGLDPSAPEVIEAWFQNYKNFILLKYIIFRIFSPNLIKTKLKIYILNNEKFEPKISFFPVKQSQIQNSINFYILFIYKTHLETE